LINNRQQNGRRRGRGGQQPRNGQQNPHSNNRIDNRQRGNAAQLLEKYKTLARDAQMAGDRVNTEYYLQFADHYFRVLSENRARFEEQQGQQQQRGRTRDEFNPDDESEEDGNPFTRPYAPREAAGDEGWDDEDNDAQAAPQPTPQAQPPRERRDFQPRDRRPVQAERGDRTERDGQGERDGAPRGGERLPRDAGNEREGGDRGAYRNGGERGSQRRANGGQPAANGARPQAEPVRAEEAPAVVEEAPSRIEIALPPALTTSAAPTGVEAAPELPMGSPVDGTEDGAPAPKRRRTRKPKADPATAEA